MITDKTVISDPSAPEVSVVTSFFNSDDWCEKFLDQISEVLEREQIHSY